MAKQTLRRSNILEHLIIGNRASIRSGDMKKGRISAAVLLLVAYLLVQYAECKNNGTEGHFLVDGIDVEKLSDDEVRDLLDAEDVKFTGQLDIWIGKQSLKERHRIKRVAPIVARVAWMAGRALYRSLSHKVPHITRSGGRMTKQYFKNGGYWSARRDFNRFKPTGVTQFRGRTNRENKADFFLMRDPYSCTSESPTGVLGYNSEIVIQRPLKTAKG
uniref:Uncharacterized protein n=1 Tax=Magallana gigas TaxID=29159 RepID=K1QNE2_MAGGI